MAKAADFLSKFDDQGRFLQGDGAVDVVLATAANTRIPAKLHFQGGLCVRIEMHNGNWAYSDNSPLDGLRLLLHFDDENTRAVFIDGGRVARHFDVADGPGKKEFLANLRVARNLFAHRSAASGAVWLTPRSVGGFNADDFPELGLDVQRDLQSAVTEFRSVALNVPPDRPPTDEQYGNAKVAFQKILQILEPYLPTPEEARKVQQAIDKMQAAALPPWVVNWDYELGSDEEGGAAVWLNLFAGEGAPSREFGRTASQLVPRLRQALSTEGVARWPYVRIRTAAEHKAG